MFKLALDTHMVGLIEEVRSIKPYLSPSLIVEQALVCYLDTLYRDCSVTDGISEESDLLELLCSEYNEGNC